MTNLFNNWQALPCFWLKGKMTCLLWVIYRENTVSIKIPTGLVIDLENILIKVIGIKRKTIRKDKWHYIFKYIIKKNEANA